MKYAINGLCMVIIVGSLGWVGYRLLQSGASPEEPQLVVDAAELDRAIREAAGALSSPAAATGDIFLEPGVVDLADLEWGSEAPFTVSLINLSPETIVIASIKTSCKCTSIDDYEESVESGEETILRFSMEAGTTIGLKRESFTVILDSGLEIASTVKANVIATYELSDGEIDFDTFRVGRDKSIKPRSILFSSDRFKIVGVETEYPWLDAKLVSAGENAFEIVLAPIVERLPVGRQRSRVYITTDYEPKKETSVVVKINVHSPIIPFPARVLLRAGRKHVVVFRDSDNKRVDIAGFETRESGLECKVTDGRLEILAKEEWQGAARIIAFDQAGNKTVVIAQFIDL